MDAVVAERATVKNNKKNMTEKQTDAFIQTALNTFKLWPSLDPVDMAKYEVSSRVAGRSLFDELNFPDVPVLDIEESDIKLPVHDEKKLASIKKQLNQPGRLKRRNARPGKE